jgi:hypothetical protein
MSLSANSQGRARDHSEGRSPGPTGVPGGSSPRLGSRGTGVSLMNHAPFGRMNLLSNTLSISMRRSQKTRRRCWRFGQGFRWAEGRLGAVDAARTRTTRRRAERCLVEEQPSPCRDLSHRARVRCGSPWRRVAAAVQRPVPVFAIDRPGGGEDGMMARATDVSGD